MAKPMRLPNGFGNINKLSGNRRKPFRARVPQGYTDDGKRIWLNLGYYAKYNEALAALVDYNRDPYSMHQDTTFAEVYEAWSLSKFEKISESNVSGYKASFNHCASIHNKAMKDIKLCHLQAIIDGSGKNYPTLKKIKSFMVQVFDYAVGQEIISKDHNKTEYIDIGKAKKSTLHFKFSHKEIDSLWAWSEKNDYVQMILMMIYSGARPGEFLSLAKSDVNLENGVIYITDGKKDNTKRIVPIYDRTLPFYKNWMSKKGEGNLITKHNGTNFDLQKNHGQFVESYWNPVLSEIGILEYKNDFGEKKEHQPHDTRHTFTSLWTEKRLSEPFRRKIQGHSGQGIGEQVYTHIDIELLKDELNKL